MQFFIRLLWFVTLLCTILSGVIIIFTTMVSKGAPQEAAGYAMACAIAIVPYVFTKAFSAMVSASRKESTDRIVQAIHQMTK